MCGADKRIRKATAPRLQCRHDEACSDLAASLSPESTAGGLCVFFGHLRIRGTKTADRDTIACLPGQAARGSLNVVHRSRGRRAAEAESNIAGYRSRSTRPIQRRQCRLTSSWRMPRTRCRTQGTRCFLLARQIYRQLRRPEVGVHDKFVGACRQRRNPMRHTEDQLSAELGRRDRLAGREVDGQPLIGPGRRVTECPGPVHLKRGLDGRRGCDCRTAVPVAVQPPPSLLRPDRGGERRRDLLFLFRATRRRHRRPFYLNGRSRSGVRLQPRRRRWPACALRLVWLGSPYPLPLLPYERMVRPRRVSQIRTRLPPGSISFTAGLQPLVGRPRREFKPVHHTRIQRRSAPAAAAALPPMRCIIRLTTASARIAIGLRAAEHHAGGAIPQHDQDEAP